LFDHAKIMAVACPAYASFPWRKVGAG